MTKWIVSYVYNGEVKQREVSADTLTGAVKTADRLYNIKEYQILAVGKANKGVHA